MRILAWTLTYWNDAAMAGSLEPVLLAWRDRMTRYLSPSTLFMASGTWSDPRHNPFLNIPIINAGVRSPLPYDYFRRHYGICAISAGLHYALNRSDWDLLVLLDQDALIGAVDFPVLLSEFMARPETLLAPGWYDGIGGPFMVWKLEGACRMAHQRLYPSLCDLSAPERPKVWEREVAAMFGTRWWNPWPQFEMLVYHLATQDPITENWPFVDRAPAWLREPFERLCGSRAVPLASNCTLADPKRQPYGEPDKPGEGV